MRKSTGFVYKQRKRVSPNLPFQLRLIQFVLRSTRRMFNPKKLYSQSLWEGGRRPATTHTSSDSAKGSNATADFGHFEREGRWMGQVQDARQARIESPGEDERRTESRASRPDENVQQTVGERVERAQATSPRQRRIAAQFRSKY